MVTMNMIYYLKLYMLSVPVFLLIDGVWLGVVAKGFYQRQLEDFLTPDVNWGAALFFYLLYVVGVIIFAVQPALEKESLARAVLLGGMFGLFAYATYDLTNLATLKGWPITVVVVDIIWGMVLTATVASASFCIGKWLR